MSKKTKTICFLLCVLFFTGIETKKIMLTGKIIGANIYDTHIIVENNVYRQITIENRNIAKNIGAYLGDEVKIEKNTKSWRGYFQRSYYCIVK
ncbi:hypothetical protein [Paraclostridium sordellii]|uniref:hypothetical protein n=1 Tax=Paraclostridium sordellii TaxID=1505 RepID=UPI0005E0CEFE|nr:hypothetical protein [Paeniclostridium sordellii]CEN83392.1 Uncharacterised protein [[Clostridium] sordellii] [Paeniclostridium sordellii]